MWHLKVPCCGSAYVYCAVATGELSGRAGVIGAKEA